MFDRLRRLFGLSPKVDQFTATLDEAAQAAADMDWDDPDVRTAASLYLILSKQFDVIGKPEGVFPYTAPFATDKARGALLGTAIAVVREQRGETPHQAVHDAAIAAFTLAYGAENGPFYALQALRDAADGNEDVNYASDWAIKDTIGAFADASPATPMAFYIAVAGML